MRGAAGRRTTVPSSGHEEQHASDLATAQTWAALPRSGGRPASELIAPTAATHDIADIQVHASDHGVRATAIALGARAFTVGRHIYLGPSTPSPGTLAGRAVLKHELGHAEAAAPGTGPSAGIAARPATAAQERAADRLGGPRSAAAVARSSGPVTPVPGRPRLGAGVVGLDPLPPTDTAAPAADLVPQQTRTGADEPGPPAPDRREVDELDYAFVFTGGGYGRSAEAFIRRYHPDHRLVRATSIEALFDRLHTDLQAHPRGRRAHLRELVIVTHANAAGGMRIPLTRDDRALGRFFTVWDVDDLQEEFAEGLHARFRRRRSEVVSAMIDADTSVVVRGCEFGQSAEALAVLRSLLGGQPMVWAPRVYQGYEAMPIGASMLQTPEEAFDFLVEQDFLPIELQPAEDEDKRAYIARVFGREHLVPTEFFVVGPAHHAALNRMVESGTGFSEAAEQHKVRGESALPSVGEYWALSAPSIAGDDAELDRLTLREIAERARALNHPYRPQNACMLRRLERAWDRKVSDSPFFFGYLTAETNDPLYGMPGDSLSFMRYLQRHFRDDPAANPLNGLTPESYFGDSNLLAVDAARFPCDTPHEDTFETRELHFEVDDTARTEATTYDEDLVNVTEDREVRPSGPHPGQSRAAPEPEAAEPTAAERRAAALDFDKTTPDLPPVTIDVTELTNRELGQWYQYALDNGDSSLLARVEDEFARRVEDPERFGFGTAVPRGLAPGVPANAGVSPDVAIEILRNMSQGRFPWRPELGEVGGVAWFVTEGNPAVGRNRGGSVTIPVELINTEGGLVFREADLVEIFERERAAMEPRIEAEFREMTGIDAATRLTRKMRRNLARMLYGAAERRMWEVVGQTVRDSPGGVGEVILEDSQFSRPRNGVPRNGRFGIVARAADVRVRGGVETVLSSLEAVAEPVDPVLAAAAEEAATQQRWAGRVRGVFRYGGRVLIVVGLVNDAYRIYTARNRTREVISVAGGWAGATAAGAAFAAWYTPADTAGPWAWVGHGVGTLIAGGVGYFIGSETTTTVYELVVDDD